MLLWYVARLTTYLDLTSALRVKDPVQLQVESYISNKRFSKSGHLASYASCHNAMAYDIQWGFTRRGSWTTPESLAQQQTDKNCVGGWKLIIGNKTSYGRRNQVEGGIDK